MTLEEAKSTFLNKKCTVYWGPLDRPERKGESLPQPTEVTVSEVYENYAGELLFRCVDKLYMPFRVERLRLVE
jgi:hypothetical protein